MEQYNNLDLECEESVSEIAARFGGMLKKSSKREPTGNLVDSEGSNSSGGLNDNTKEKGGVFKGVLGKSTKSVREETPVQASLPVPSRELSSSSDSLNKNPSKEKTGVFGGILKRSPKPGHSRSESQDNFSMDGDLNGSSDSLSENNNPKEKGSKFGAMFKKSNWTKEPNSASQEDLSVSDVSSQKSGSSDNLSEGKDGKEKGGMFGGVFKKPKSLFARSQSREDLTSDLSVSSDNLSEGISKARLSVQSGDLSASNDSLNNNKKSPKEKTGFLGGILKQTPKPGHRRTESQDHLSLDGDLSNSNDSLSADNAKEKGSKFGGMFKGWTKGANDQAQENLSASGELKGSVDNLSEGKEGKEKGGLFSGVFKKNKRTMSREDLTADSELSASTDTLGEKTAKQNSSNSDGEEETTDPQSGHKQNKLTGAMMNLNPFYFANKHYKHPGSDEEPTADEKTSSNKQSSVAGAMAMMNPFRSATKKDVGQAENNKEVEQQGEEKSKLVKSGPYPRERMDRSGAQSGPVKPAKENQSDDEVLTDREEGSSVGGEDVKPSGTKAAKVKKPKRHNPFMPRVSDQAPSDDEGLNEDEPLNTEEGNAVEEGNGQEVGTKPKKTKKHNPFLPRVKVRPKKNPQDEPTATDNAPGNERSLFDRLEDFRIGPDESNDQDVEGLMEWWSTVEQWEDMPKEDDMTEKEEAKAFALTAEKVQRGIRVFNKLFTERAESLWQHVLDLNAIADNLDRFNKKTKIAQITGGSTSALGGVATIAGLALAPVTFGTSLIITAVGLGVATAGGLTSAGAGISNQVNNSLDRKKVEKIVEDYQEKMADINKCMTFIKQGIENLRRFDLLKMRKHAYNRDFPALNNIYEDGAMLGKAILINANEIMRVVQIANVAGSTAARAVQIASMATGVLTGLFVGMDIYFVAKDSKELKKGAKSEFAAKIREVAVQLHEGLVELNGIRDELQSTTSHEDPEAVRDLNKPEGGEEEERKPEEEEEEEEKPEKKPDEEKPDEDSEEDEIDRIKKAIKKDCESREYV
ncbi:papilin-like isoform X7 [Gadus macrocephalus]|uniref:papilin-like isoform X7 n=1 Tax=Gadus macrocephalus TaxID=80720 RepID=UPI0028CB9ECF|nr:papilin-like isoform X7 [Gadus macrocephalus]